MSISSTETNLDIRLEIFKLARDKNKTRNLAVELIEKYKNSPKRIYLNGEIHAFYNIKSEQFTIKKVFGETILATPLPISIWGYNDPDFDKLIKLGNINPLHDYLHEQLHILMGDYKNDLLDIYFRDDDKPRSYFLDTFRRLEIGDNYEVCGYILPEWMSTHKMKDILDRYLVLNKNLSSNNDICANDYTYSYDDAYLMFYKIKKFKNFKNDCYEDIKNQILNSTFDFFHTKNKYELSRNAMYSLLYEIDQEIGREKFIKAFNYYGAKYDLKYVLNKFKALDKKLKKNNPTFQ